MNELIIDETGEQPMFQKFDIVWAKILGWPWWPARITQIPLQKDGNYKVQFFGDTSHAFLPEDKLFNYAQGRDRHSTPKGHYRNFAKALGTADKLLESIIIPKDDAQSQTTLREKIPGQQNQIINQSQQVQTNVASKILNTNQQQLGSTQVRAPLRLTRKPKKVARVIPKHNGHMSKQSKQKIQLQVKALLKKYKLEPYLDQKPRRDVFKGLKKTKMIAKNIPERQSRLQILTKLARVINKILSKKAIDIKQRYEITLTLMDSVIKYKEKGLLGTHRALFQWIRCCDSETIQKQYKQWPVQSNCYDNFTTGASLGIFAGQIV